MMNRPGSEIRKFQFSDDLKEAVRLHQKGNLEEARQIYLRILDHYPENSDALHLLGVIAHQTGAIGKAVHLISRAIQLSPGQASYYLNLGNAYRAKDLLAQAVTCFNKAIDIKPDYADAYYNLGNTLSAQGKVDSAVPYYQHAVQLKPKLPAAYLNLGRIFEQQGAKKQAVSWYMGALQADTSCVEACIRLGSLYQTLNNHLEAVQCFQRAAAAGPDDCFRLYNNLGVSQQALGNLTDSIASFEKATQLNPGYAVAHYNLGVSYHANGELHKAINVLEKAVALKPAYSDAVNLLVHLLQRTCDWQNLDRFALKLDKLTSNSLETQTPTAEAVYTNVCRHPDPALNYYLARGRSLDIAKKTTGINLSFSYDRSAAGVDKIILGYFSADFNNHPIAHLTRGLFKLHNRDFFKVYCYSYGNDDGSTYRAQIARDSDRFIDVSKLNTPELARCINDDKVCILIDLMGYTNGNRLDVCALRPSPLQLTWLGFPGTTGAEFFDYIITDKIVSPEGHASFYSENFVYMPHCYQVNNNCQEIADCEWQRRDFGLPEHGFVFSSFNQPVKVDPLMFDCWMRILKKVSNSVLWLLWDNRIAEVNLRSAAQERGINPNRLVFAKKLSKEKHLARMRLADLALDTRVYNGHTTTSDSLWAGTPVIALQGTHFASRVSASILTAIELPELITQDLTEYENLAVHLALNRDNLIHLRQKLKSHRNTKPLFDTARFTKNLEFAFQEMWRVYQQGDPPCPITVKENENF